MELQFLGGTGTVTGSKYLVHSGERRILVDCGLFQGLKQLRLRNRAPLPIDPARVDAVLLTHAHLDHSGYLPLLVRDGFSGPVYCSAATRDLCGLLLPDSGHLQEEEADYANREGYSRHRPALPLYTQADAERALGYLVPLAWETDLDLGDGLAARLLRAGHILGAAMVRLESAGRSLLFTGDLGRPTDPLLPPPTPVEQCDHLVLESTYGGREHEQVDPSERLARIITRTAARGGAVLVPAFAVGRTQLLLYLLHQLRASGRIPELPVYVDSPMAMAATEIFTRHPEEHRLGRAAGAEAMGSAIMVRSVEESRALDRGRFPMVLISASGMATGGRVLHHLKAMAGDARNTVLFAGYQAAGTRGAAMLAGARALKIHGRYVEVRAEVEALDSISAHADTPEILAWLGNFRTPPRETFLTHGEPVAADALRLKIEETLHWRCSVPEYLEQRALS